MDNVTLFQDKKIRSEWNEEEQHWYFSVVDVVGALIDSVNPTDYFKKMRKRDDSLYLPGDKLLSGRYNDRIRKDFSENFFT